MDVQSLKIDRSPPGGGARRRRRSPLLGRVVVLLTLAGLAWIFWGPITAFVDRVRLPVVRIARVVESHPAAAGAVQGTAANGHIVASRRAALSADTPGRIVEMNVTEGSVVRKGDVVARLYADEYAASLRAAEAELEAARVQGRRAGAAIRSAQALLEQEQKSREAAAEDVAVAQANHALAQENFARARDLLARGVSSQQAFDGAKADLDGTAAQLRAAQARQRAAEAGVVLATSRLEEAHVDQEAADATVVIREATRALAAATLDKTEVRAPFDGIVVLKDAEVGEVVSPNSQGGSTARGAVCTMVDLNSLEAQAEVPEASLAAVTVGGPAQVYLDAYPGRPYAGRVDRIWPTANRQKATVEVRIQFAEPDELLRPEMGVRIVFTAGEPEASPAGEADRGPAILIPQDAVVEIEGDSGVFVVERDVARFAPVELGERKSGRVAVRRGLTPGQRIVLAPPPGLQSGDRVRIEES